MSFKMTLENATDQALWFIVYQHFPEFGLDSVVWKVCGLPAQDEDSQPPTKTITWSLYYGVALSNFNTETKTYSIIKNVDATLGMKYAVTTTHPQGIPDISKESIGPAVDGTIILANKTADPSKKVNTGFSIDGVLVGAERSVGGGEESVFTQRYHYHVACLSSALRPGQEFNHFPGVKFIIPAIEVTYPKGMYKCNVKAYKPKSDDYSLTVNYN